MTTLPVLSTKSRAPVPVEEAPSQQSEKRRTGDGADALIKNAAIASAVFVGTLMVWSIAAPIKSAVVAAGTVEVESNLKAIQHLEGGIVATINVRENQFVKKDELLLEFDDAKARADLANVEAQLADQMAKATRLQAALASDDNMVEPKFPKTASKALRQKVRDSYLVQESLFQARKRAFETEVNLLNSQEKKLGQQIAGLETQIASLARQIGGARKELSIATKLRKEGFQSEISVIQLQRSVEELITEKAALETQLAAAQEEQSASGLELARLELTQKQTLSEEYAGVQTALAALTEEHQKSKAILERTSVFAPRDGRVLALSVHTIGGVVRPGEQIMSIVPDDDRLVLSAKVSPADIDKIERGASARVRFTSLSGGMSPEIETEVIGVSADALDDERTGSVYFKAILDLPEKKLASLLRQGVSPGMPAEVYIETGTQPAIAYLSKPLTDSFARTFREE
ncbi:MAG: HlyD family type I secretion periplasmic adaptor subunit [Pseudomonadota bacterium]